MAAETIQIKCERMTDQGSRVAGWIQKMMSIHANIDQSMISNSTTMIILMKTNLNQLTQLGERADNVL